MAEPRLPPPPAQMSDEAQSWAQLLIDQLQQLYSLAPSYTTATRPAIARAGKVIYVSDGGVGAVFQGWNGTTWVNLG